MSYSMSTYDGMPRWAHTFRLTNPAVASQSSEVSYLRDPSSPIDRIEADGHFTDIPQGPTELSDLLFAFNVALTDIDEIDWSKSQPSPVSKLLFSLPAYVRALVRLLNHDTHLESFYSYCLTESERLKTVQLSKRIETIYSAEIIAIFKDRVARLESLMETSPDERYIEFAFKVWGEQIFALKTNYLRDFTGGSWLDDAACLPHVNLQDAIRNLKNLYSKHQLAQHLPATWSPSTESLDEEAMGLWYLIWRNLCRLYEDVEGENDTFPSVDYCLEVSFFRSRKTRKLFHIAQECGSFALGQIVDDLVVQYCKAIRKDWGDGDEPSSHHLDHLRDDLPLLPGEVASLKHFGLEYGQSEAPLDALHRAALRISRVPGFESEVSRKVVPPEDLSPGEIERFEHLVEDGTYSVAQLSQFDTEEQSEFLSANSGQKKGVKDKGLHGLVDVTAGRPKSARMEKPFSPTANSSNDIRSAAFEEPVIVPRPASTKSRQNLKVTASSPISAIDTLVFSAGGISVAMDESPIGDTRPIELAAAERARPKSSNLLIEAVHQDFLSAFERVPHDPEHQRSHDEPLPGGVYRLSEHDYVHNPFPENRAHEVAQSRHIARDLRTPGIMSRGLKPGDLLNLPPIHCRSTKDLPNLLYKKRTPLGPYEALRILGRLTLRRLRIGKWARGEPVITRPLIPTPLKSRLSCRHHRHVSDRSSARVKKVRRASHEYRPVGLRGGGGRLPGREPLQDDDDGDDDADDDEGEEEEEGEDEEDEEENTPPPRFPPGTVLVPPSISADGDPREPNASASNSDATTDQDDRQHTELDQSGGRQPLRNLVQDEERVGPGQLAQPYNTVHDPVAGAIRATARMRHAIGDEPDFIPCHPCPFVVGEVHHVCPRRQCEGLTRDQALQQLRELGADLAPNHQPPPPPAQQAPGDHDPGLWQTMMAQERDALHDALQTIAASNWGLISDNDLEVIAELYARLAVTPAVRVVIGDLHRARELIQGLARRNDSLAADLPTVRMTIPFPFSGIHWQAHGRELQGQIAALRRDREGLINGNSQLLGGSLFTEYINPLLDEPVLDQHQSEFAQVRSVYRRRAQMNRILSWRTFNQAQGRDEYDSGAEALPTEGLAVRLDHLAAFQTVLRRGWTLIDGPDQRDFEAIQTGLMRGPADDLPGWIAEARQQIHDFQGRNDMRSPWIPRRMLTGDIPDYYLMDAREREGYLTAMRDGLHPHIANRHTDFVAIHVQPVYDLIEASLHPVANENPGVTAARQLHGFWEGHRILTWLAYNHATTPSPFFAPVDIHADFTRTEAALQDAWEQAQVVQPLNGSHDPGQQGQAADNRDGNEDTASQGATVSTRTTGIPSTYSQLNQQQHDQGASASHDNTGTQGPIAGPPAPSIVDQRGLGFQATASGGNTHASNPNPTTRQLPGRSTDVNATPRSTTLGDANEVEMAQEIDNPVQPTMRSTRSQSRQLSIDPPSAVQPRQALRSIQSQGLPDIKEDSEDDDGARASRANKEKPASRKRKHDESEDDSDQDDDDDEEQAKKKATKRKPVRDKGAATKGSNTKGSDDEDDAAAPPAAATKPASRAGRVNVGGGSA